MRRFMHGKRGREKDLRSDEYTGSGTSSPKTNKTGYGGDVNRSSQLGNSMRGKTTDNNDKDK